MTSSVHARLRACHVTLIAAAAVLAIALVATARSLVGGSLAGPLRSGGPAGMNVPGTPGKVSGDLARLVSTAPGRQVTVIIQLSHGVSSQQGQALVSSLAGRPGRDLHIINGLSARLSARAAAQLAASPLVRAVSLNAAVKESSVNFNPTYLATNFDQSTGATRLWGHWTGRGVGVAVIDTGVQGDLPDFRASQSSTSSRVIASAVIDPGATQAGDSYGHGTAVAGLIGGNGGYRDSGDGLWGKYAGTAPDANLVSIKISNETGQATTLDAIYGLQFAVDHQRDYNIRVVNMSFRSTSAQSYQTDPLDAAAESAWFHGIVVVAAAGNLGTASDAVSYAPANDPYVLTVGGLDEQSTRSPYDDMRASWSSQGVTQDGVSKPDVLAPGAHIVSTLAQGSSFASQCPTCVISGSYVQLSGTSLAAPIISGVAADLLAAHPTWTPAQVKGAIVNTALPLASGATEANAGAAVWASGAQLSSDTGLVPNTSVDPATGNIDYSAASWSAASWSTATDPLAASWSAASWSCVDCSPGGSGGVTPTSASWSTVGWSTFWG